MRNLARDKSLLHKMRDAKQYYDNLRRAYLAKVKSVKDHTDYWKKSGMPGYMIGQIVLSMAFDIYHLHSISYTKSNLVSGAYSYYYEECFNVAHVFHTKRDGKQIIDMLDADDWKLHVSMGRTKLGYDEFIASMKSKPVDDVIDILMLRNDHNRSYHPYHVGVYSMPEILRGEFLVIATI
jgi:hypothetical protein